MPAAGRLAWAALVLGLGGTVAAGGEPQRRFGRVVTPGGQVLRVELADTPALLMRGYMFRPRPGPEDGMLLVFPEDGPHGIWMKNCRFPLDLVWIAADGTVVQVEAGAPPCEEDPCRSYTPPGAARYVLEIPSPRDPELGIRPGSYLEVLLPSGPP